jgi:hypothetical protein
VLLLSKAVKHCEGMLAIVDNAEVVVQLMGIKDPAHEIHIYRIIVHNENGQRSMKGWSIHK